MPEIYMVRLILITVVLTSLILSTSIQSAQATNVWLSSSGDIATGSSPPASLGQVQTITRLQSDTQGAIYIWARPTADKTLQNWSLRAVSSDPSIVSLTGSSVDVFNPVLVDNGIPIVRWQTVAEPADPSLASTSLKGLNIFDTDRSGIGIGPDSDGIQNAPTPDEFVDGFYHAGTNSWLLASIDYTLHGVLGQAAIHLQIGELGLNYLGEHSSQANVVFGLVSDLALNANTQRNMSSTTADLFIAVSDMPAPSGDFDADGDIDGRDFLAWQRSFGITGGATQNQGDANFDGAVNSVDLGIWQNQYGQPPQPVAQATQVPEPVTAMQLAITLMLGYLFFAKRCWKPQLVLCPSRCRRS